MLLILKPPPKIDQLQKLIRIVNIVLPKTDQLKKVSSEENVTIVLPKTFLVPNTSASLPPGILRMKMQKYANPEVNFFQIFLFNIKIGLFLDVHLHDNVSIEES